ncbi:M48 family metalloprotease [Desulfatiferula olefinivorans]
MKAALSLALLMVLISAPGSLQASESARTRISSLEETSPDIADLEAEILFGRDLAARILGNYKAVDDPALIRYVNLIGTGLVVHSGRSDLEFRFIILDSDEINAFATPGGYIFVTLGAVKRMDNEAQLACVLGHEIAHVTQRHVVRRLNIKGDETSAFSALSGAIGSSTAAVRTLLEKTLDEASAVLFETGYTIKEEMEADRVGMQIASLAGYDARQLGVFLKSCKGFEKPDASYTGKHPQLNVRLSSMARTLKENGLDKLSQAKVRRRFHDYVHP